MVDVYVYNIIQFNLTSLIPYQTTQGSEVKVRL